MKRANWSALFMIVGISVNLSFGCSDDDEDDDGQGGTAGTAGTAGSGGTAGTAGTGGRGGSAGGDASAGSGGAATDGGDGGDAADSGPLGQCAYGCEEHSDCFLPGHPFDPTVPPLDAYKACVAGQCRVACTQAAHCHAEIERWVAPPCGGGDAGTACPEGRACVDIGSGRGVCALVQSGECAGTMQSVAVPLLGGDGGTAQVCVQNPNVGCDLETGCYIQDCPTGTCDPLLDLTYCDTATGRCGCNADSECNQGSSGTKKCNTATHQCDECGSDNDCAMLGNGDRCVNGRCGCSGAAGCTRPYTGASKTCE